MKSYHHFSYSDRICLFILCSIGLSIRQVARVLQRSPSSISRELARNKTKNEGYQPWHANILSQVRRKRCVRHLRLQSDDELRDWVVQQLQLITPPEILAHVWNQQHPQNTVCTATIYRALKRNVLPNCSRKKNLSRHGKQWRNRKKDHKCDTIHPNHLITERPVEASNRSRLGDWEGDTIYGGIGQGLVVTCVDRTSRFLRMVLLKSRNQTLTKEAIIQALSGQVVHTLTLDNGSEFAKFKELEQAIHATIYFAHRHAPWERGTNENTNGKIRVYFPKGTNFHKVTQEQLDKVAFILNSRPHKCLGWLSPIEFIQKKCCT